MPGLSASRACFRRRGQGYGPGMPAPRAVITGGAGFLGSWVADELASRGYDVVCVDNLLTGRPENLADSQHELVVADVTQAIPVSGPIQLVLHLASPASPPAYLAHPTETLRVGSVGTENALELAREHRARFVMASTSEVYGDPEQHPQRESYWGNVNPIGPRSVYDEAKRYAEALTASYRRQHLVDAAIVRIFNTYGPRMRADDGRVVTTFLAQADRGEPLTVQGDGTQSRSLCFVTDTARGIVDLALSDEPGPVNLGRDDEVTVLELAKTVVELCRSSSRIEFVPRAVDDPQVRCPDLTVARTRLGWEPRVDLDDGLLRTRDWMRSLAALTERHGQHPVAQPR
jgi:dTDP-glucose 4,6-dehydratase